MTKPKSECRACGRIEGHYLNCPNSPRPNEIIIPAFEPEMDSVCLEDGCEEPTKSSRAKYCAEHSTPTAYVMRSQRKNAEKENAE